MYNSSTVERLLVWLAIIALAIWAVVLLNAPVRAFDLPAGVIIKDGVYQIPRSALKSYTREEIREARAYAKENGVRFVILRDVKARKVSKPKAAKPSRKVVKAKPTGAQKPRRVRPAPVAAAPVPFPPIRNPPVPQETAANQPEPPVQTVPAVPAVTQPPTPEATHRAPERESWGVRLWRWLWDH